MDEDIETTEQDEIIVAEDFEDIGSAVREAYAEWRDFGGEA